MNSTKIKICGIRRMEDIELMNAVCPDFCGFVINFPKSHRSLTPKEAAALTEKLRRNRIKAVGVFVDESPETVAALLNAGVIDIAQLHGGENEEYIEHLRTLTEKPVIKAFTVRSAKDIADAAASSADYILLDSGKGSGKGFDHSLLGENLQLIKSKKWFLAGGIDAGNINEASERFCPYAVDLSSAAETDGFKDPEKVHAIMRNVRRDNL